MWRMLSETSFMQFTHTSAIPCGIADVNMLYIKNVNNFLGREIFNIIINSQGHKIALQIFYNVLVVLSELNRQLENQNLI